MPQHQDDAAATQAAGVLCEIEAVGASLADGHASQTIEPCLPEHPAALTTSQTGGEVDQAMNSTPESAVPEPSEPIIVDENGGRAIVIDDSDEGNGHGL